MILQTAQVQASVFGWRYARFLARSWWGWGAGETIGRRRVKEEGVGRKRVSNFGLTPGEETLIVQKGEAG